MGLNELSLAELRKKLKSGEVTPAEIVEDIYDAIERDRENESPLNAYISFDLNRIEEYIKKDFWRDTLLEGVPIGIKDVINVKGENTTCGSKILDRYISPYDATSIIHLKKNGGIPCGKLNMDEFAMGSSNENSAFGAVRNPHDRTRVPGGSSGGPAAAVAGNLAIAALGSDTGGSIRQPASMCGVFGIKPTYGRVSRYGLVAYASSFDQIGPITKTVEDGAILLNCIAGFDSKDSTSADEPVPNFQSYLDKGVKGLVAGIPEEYFGEGLDPEVRERIEQGIKILEEAGIRTKRLSLAYTKYAVATYYIIATAEASSNLARFDGIRYGRWFVETDDLQELYKINRSSGFGKEVKRRIMLGTFTLSSGYYDAYYLKAQKARTLIREDFKRAFDEVQLILTPVSPVPAWEIGKLVDDPLKMYLSDIYTVPVNLAGLPASSVPCGKTKEGLPVGLQIIANHFREDLIFRASRVVEKEMG